MGLKTRIWKVFCFGNHDYGEYVTWPSEAAKENNFKAIKICTVKILVNELNNILL
jgi:hypothetical protein